MHDSAEQIPLYYKSAYDTAVPIDATAQDEEIKERDVEKMRNLIAFFICGLMNNYSYVVMLSSAEHMVLIFYLL